MKDRPEPIKIGKELDDFIEVTISNRRGVYFPRAHGKILLLPSGELKCQLRFGIARAPGEHEDDTYEVYKAVLRYTDRTGQCWESTSLFDVRHLVQRLTEYLPMGRAYNDSNAPEEYRRALATHCLLGPRDGGLYAYNSDDFHFGRLALPNLRPKWSNRTVELASFCLALLVDEGPKLLVRLDFWVDKYFDMDSDGEAKGESTLIYPISLAKFVLTDHMYEDEYEGWESDWEEYELPKLVEFEPISNEVQEDLQL